MLSGWPVNLTKPRGIRNVSRCGQQECPDFEHREVWGNRFLLVSHVRASRPGIITLQVIARGLETTMARLLKNL